MFHVIQLTTWILATGLRNQPLRLAFTVAAVSQLCLSSYWFGASDFTETEMISSVCVAVLGIAIGSGIRRHAKMQGKDEITPPEVIDV